MNFIFCLVFACAYQYVGGIFMLPGEIYPKNYDITLLYDIDSNSNFSFFGVVDIMLKTTSEISKIVLFAKDIRIAMSKIRLTSISHLIVINDDNGNVQTNDIIEDILNNYYTIHLTKNLLPNETYILSIPFNGNLKEEQSEGVYVGKYLNKQTQEVEYYIKTNFEPMNARQCFPSFDEPQYKATFTLTLGHHRDYRAISNMPLANTTRVNALDNVFPWHFMEASFGKKKNEFSWDDFKISKPMSTHQLAFMISKYSAVRSTVDVISNNTAWSRPEVIDQAAYVISASWDIVSFYEKFFQVSFPLPKLDHVFEYAYVPNSTTSFGLVTYPESLLFDKNNFRKDVKLELVNMMSNQIAHQWFGNLVTLRYWSENWLKEGFAIFMAHLSMGALLFGKNIRRQDIASDNPWVIKNFTLTERSPNTFVNLFEAVLTEDGLPSAGSMALPIELSDIRDIYNEISNYKAAILFRMLYRIIGHNSFKEALHKFLTKYTYQTIVQYDLWTEMDNFFNTYKIIVSQREIIITVKTFMDSWIRQPGYPLLNATRNYDSKTITISQQRFFSSDQKPDKSTWWVPLVVLSRDDYQRGELPVQWLLDQDGTAPHLFEHGARADEWLVLNAHALGLYRVNYDIRNWQMLSMTLRSNEYSLIPPLSRAQLLSDSLALARKGLLDYTIALRLAKYLEHEDDSAVLKHGLRQLMKIETMFRRTPDYEAFQKYMRLIVEKPFGKYDGLKMNSYTSFEINNFLIQKYVSRRACDMNVPRCLNDAVNLFRKWMDTKDPDKNNPIPIDLRDTVYCWGVALGTMEQWQFILQRAYNATTSERADALNALACTREASHMQRTLNLLTNGSFNDDVTISAITTLMRNPVGFYVSSDFLYQKTTVFFSGKLSINIKKNLISEFTSQFISQDELDEFMAWRNVNLKLFPEELEPTINHAIDTVGNNLAWIKKYQKTILSDLLLLSQDQGGSVMALKTSRNKGNIPNDVLTTPSVIFICYTYLLKQITSNH